MTSPMISASAASSSVTGIAFLRDTGIGSFVKIESPGLRLTICQSQSRYCSWYGLSSPSSLRSFASSFSPTLPDSPISAISASPGMTRIRPKTIGEESARTGNARRSRRITYRCIAAQPLACLLLVEPHSRGRRRAIAVGTPQRERGHVPEVRMIEEEAPVVRHPYPEHLVELAVDDLLGDRALIVPVGSLPELQGQLVDDRIVDAEEILRGLGVHVHVRPLVEANRVPGLEAPGHPVPFVLDVAAVVRRVVELLDLDVDVEVLLEVLLHQLNLRGHLRPILVVEQGRLETVAVACFRQELLRLRRAILPPRPELFQCRGRVLVIHVRHAPAGDPVALEHRVDLLLAVDRHRDGASHPDVVIRGLVLRERDAERREHVLVLLHD